jgi:ribosomal protein S21
MSSSYQTKTFVEITRERTEELRKREVERYETLLRERLKERYPSPSPEQKHKIEARVHTAFRVVDRDDPDSGAEGGNLFR